ncbi:helix-turn-helix domain-containing protein [Xanthomonas arboricola]|uniref:helix-turn-helix domain-containing protein n=1 Tax=Xanthomonas arboricola TaxID=56448 RepID=UPI00187B878F|nr:helix-turn-helix domain-containing protein [Xanthomonas arboricola]
MSQQAPVEKLSYTVEQAMGATGMSRSAFYKAISKAGLVTFKLGKRRMVSARALQQFIEAQEREASRRSVA